MDSSAEMMGLSLKTQKGFKEAGNNIKKL
jgi:hypothetical protein